MNRFIASALIAAGLSTSVALPAAAQVASVDSVVAACATPGASTDGCLAAQAAYIAALQAQGLTAAQIDAAIGNLVVALAEAAPANPAVIAAAISAAAQAVTNPSQQAAILQVASSVAAGQPVATPLATQAASPN